MKRSTLLTLTALLLAPLAALHAGESDSPIVGAIRWDGWYGEGGSGEAGGAIAWPAEVSFSAAVVR